MGVLLRIAIWVFMAGVIGVEGLGVNWGTQATHKLPPKTVVEMLKANGIKKVKLFDAEESTMSALAGSGIEVMVAIPNMDLLAMNSYSRAKQWVRRNVTRYLFNGGVDIKYVAVGNEPFLKSYGNSFLNTTFPALQNIQTALNAAGVGAAIKATVPFNADIYDSPADNPVPSAGRFRPDIAALMTSISDFLAANNAPFTINIYPFLSLYANAAFPFDFAFFGGGAAPIADGDISYTNVFDANFDTLVSALAAVGHPTMQIIVGEVGWPTDGDKNASPANAARFYKGLMSRLAAGSGTPLRPGHMEVYLFGLLDEDAKSVAPGAFERHWGVFAYDGKVKFDVDLSGGGAGAAPAPLVGARKVEYLPRRWCVANPNVKDLGELKRHVQFACTYADCTAMGYGSSCNGLGEIGNASYAFNMYYQAQNQDRRACVFGGMAVMTKTNASTGSCDFIVQIQHFYSGARRVGSSFLVMVFCVLLGLVWH